MRISKTSREMRRARKMRKAQALATAFLLWLFEVFAAAAIGAIPAVIIVPIALGKRGYVAFGGEWLVVLAITLLAYHIIHKAVFKRLEN